MTKKEINTLTRKLEAHRKRVAKERDALREFAADVESLADTCDRAEGALQEAIDALSELA